MTFDNLMQWTGSLSGWFLAALVLLTALAHLACLRSPDIQEPPPKEMARRIKIAGLVLVSISWWTRLLDGVHIVIAPVVIMGLTLLLFGELMATVVRLYEYRDVFIPGIERRKPVVTRVLTTVVLNAPEASAKSTVIETRSDDAA